MGMKGKWTRVIDEFPPEDTEVETKVDDLMGVRNEQELNRDGRIWFKADGTEVDYTPTHWRKRSSKQNTQ
jgi:hypothetical protein